MLVCAVKLLRLMDNYKLYLKYLRYTHRGGRCGHTLERRPTFFGGKAAKLLKTTLYRTTIVVHERTQLRRLCRQFSRLEER